MNDVIKSTFSTLLSARHGHRKTAIVQRGTVSNEIVIEAPSTEELDEFMCELLDNIRSDDIDCLLTPEVHVITKRLIAYATLLLGLVCVLSLRLGTYVYGIFF